MALGAAATTIALTAIDVLSALDIARDDTWIEPLLAGDLLPFLSSKDLWSAFPLVPTGWRNTLGIISAIWIVASVAGGTFLLRRMLRRSWSAVGFWVLLAGALPIVAGSYGAFAGITSPTMAGPWVATMIQSLLYGGTVCIACGLLDVIAPNLAERRSVAQRPATA